MSALEQSLDAIIAQNKKSVKPLNRRNLKGSKKPQVASKNVVQKKKVVNKKVVNNKIANLPTGPKKSVLASSLDVATKVVVSGLPKDLKQHTIKVC